MSRIRPTPLIWSLVLIAVTVGALSILLKAQHSRPSANETTQPIRGGILAPMSHKGDVHLYFSMDHDNFLVAEPRPLAQPDDDAAKALVILRALIDGSRKGFIRTVPAQTGVNAVYVTADKTAYVDLSAEVTEQHPGGVQTELLTVYSIVNSLVLNIEAVEQVKILIDGRDTETLAGHLNLRSPLKADMLLVR